MFFAKAFMPRVTGIIQSAPLRIVYISFNLFEYSRGTLVPYNISLHFIAFIKPIFFSCRIESLFVRNSFVFCELLCRTVRFKFYCSKLVSPSPCADVIPVFSGTSSRTHRILSPPHTHPQAANRRLSLPKVSAAAALLQTVHCVCRLKLSTSRTRGPAQ